MDERRVELRNAASDDGRYSLRCAPPALANAGAKVAAATRATDDENFISIAQCSRERRRSALGSVQLYSERPKNGMMGAQDDAYKFLVTPSHGLNLSAFMYSRLPRTSV